MYLLLVTLIFSLALSPDVWLLRAQEMNTELMSMLQTQQSAIFSTRSPEENLPTPAEETANIMHEVESLTTIAEIVEPTSEEHTSMPIAELQTTPELPLSPELQTTPEHPLSPELQTTPELPLSPELQTTPELPLSPELQTTPELPLSPELQTTPDIFTTPKPLPTAESTVIPVSNTMKTYDPAAPPEPTTPEQEESTEITTTESPLITSPPPNIPHPKTKSTKPPETPETVSNEKVKTTDTSPTTTPLTTTPTDIHTSPEETSLTDSSSGTISVGSSTEESKKGVSRLIIGVIALVMVCILTTLCIMAIIIKRRRQSGQQNFKMKKGTEKDIWAGPVKLGGRDCEGPEEADAQGEEKKMDGVEEAGLSTFYTLQENGGVGRPGSPEVEKWEEKEPLLFIDEEGKEKSKEAGKETDVKQAEPNGGETFCLTTAV